MASRPQCSRRRSAFFLSSRFDAREQSERCRLNCTRRAVQTARIVRFEKQFENLRVLRVTVRSAVFSVSDVTSCKRSDGVVAGKDPARIQGTADVRTEHHRRECGSVHPILQRSVHAMGTNHWECRSGKLGVWGPKLLHGELVFVRLLKIDHGSAAVTPCPAVHQALMQGRTLTDATWTVLESP